MNVSQTLFHGHCAVARRGFVALLATAGLAAATLPVAAQQRTLTMIVSTSPGSGLDVVAREIGQQMLASSGTLAVVENRPGASGNIAAAQVARAKPDGSTLLVAATSLAANAAINASLPYDPAKDFAPVALFATGAMCLIVPTSLPIKTVQDLIDAARARPGELNYASPGNGTLQHLTMELFKQEAGIDMLHVPFKGIGGALNDTAGAHVAGMISSVSTVMPLVNAHKLRILAVTSAERLAVLPDVPTFKELGFPKVQADTWYGLFAPAGTPPDAIARINKDVNVALKTKAVAENLENQGVQPAGGPPSVMADKLRAELDRWPPVVKAANITIN